MAWCKLEDTFVDDPKFRELAKILNLGNRIGEDRGIALAQGFITRLWSWATRHHPDGYLPADRVSDADIERVCGWPNAGGALVSGLMTVNLITPAADGARGDRKLHRFLERSGSYKAAIKKRNQRENEKTVPGQSEDIIEDVKKMSPGRGEERRGKERRGEDLFSLVPPAESAPTPIGQVRRAFIEGYAARFPNASPYPWGKRESGQAKNLLGSLPLDEALQLIPLWFRWPNKKAIDAFLTFGTGPDCFVMKFHELRGDVSHPERRQESAVVASLMRKADKAASGEVSAKDEASDLAQALLALVARRGRTWSSTCRYDGHETAEAGVAAELGAQAAEVVKRSGGWDAFCRDWGTKQGDGTARAQLRDVCEAAQSTPARRPALRLSADRQDGHGTVTVNLEGPHNEP